jgi:hypothetical protein
LTITISRNRVNFVLLHGINSASLKLCRTSAMMYFYF